NNQMIEILVGHRNAIEVIHIVARTLTRHDHCRSGLGQRGSSCSPRRNEYVVAQKGEVDELPSVQRKRGDSSIVDDFAQFGIGRLKRCRRFFNGYFLADITDFQHKIDMYLAADLHWDVLANLYLESG